MVSFVPLNGDQETIQQILRCDVGPARSFFDRLFSPPEALTKFFTDNTGLFLGEDVFVTRSDQSNGLVRVDDSSFRCHLYIRSMSDQADLIASLRLEYEELWDETMRMMMGDQPVCFIWRAHTLNVGQDLRPMKALADVLTNLRSGLFVLYLHSDAKHPFKVEGNLIIAGMPDGGAEDKIWEGVFQRIAPQLNMVDRSIYQGMSNPLPISKLDQLPDVLEYFGEFGNELVLFIPFIAWASSVGLMKDRTVLTYKGMRCFYDDLQIGHYLEKDESRSSVEAKFRPYYLPIKDEHTWDWAIDAPFHLYRNYREKFRSKTFRLPESLLVKPILVIHNKYNIEYGRGPINNIPLSSLNETMESLKHKYSIIYIRHGMSPLSGDYSIDHNTFLDYDDQSLLKSHQEVFNFDKLYTDCGSESGVNEFKSFIYSKAYYVITSQGGGSYQCASYPGGVIIVFHRFGNEMHRAYSNGFFNSLSNPAPTLMLCLDEGDISKSIRILERSSVIAGRVCFHEETILLVESLLPFAQKKIYESRQAEID